MRAARPTAPPSIELQLDAQVDALDQLVGEVRGGIRGARHFDELEERAAAIGEALRNAFRAKAA